MPKKLETRACKVSDFKVYYEIISNPCNNNNLICIGHLSSKQYKLTLFFFFLITESNAKCYCGPTDITIKQYKNGKAHTSTPNRTTLRTPGISAKAASTSGNTIENFVLGSTSLAPVKSISCTVLPRPLGYCSVTITGIPKSRAPCSCKGTGRKVCKKINY